MKFLRYLFCLQGKVSREEYVLVGVGLMILKYAVEACVIAVFTSKFYSPLDFFNPLISVRSEFIVGGPDWLGMAWVLWTLPFLCIAVAMSMRRAVDAGASPWVGMLVLIPIINFFAMLYLASIPLCYAEHRYEGLKRWDNTQPYSETTKKIRLHEAYAGFMGILIGFFYMLAIATASIYIFKSYGAALFFGTPLVVGAATAYIYNRKETHSSAGTITLSLITAALFACGFLLIGLEGFICVAMALPIVVPLGILGALVGRAIAIQHDDDTPPDDKGMIGCLLVLPLLAGAESYIAPQREFEVLSVVEIAAPVEHVWQCVVSFPEITEDPEWFFRWGISCPQGARIQGEGVGAMRYCDFTTGSFVEPVTVWDPPRVLAFDVTKQPDPMTELSPYRHIHPPHLDGSFRSTHGEFRLIPLADGRTRLEGRTWYQLEIYPHSYWTLWTDWLIHKIHGRVLRHIKQLSESEQA